MKILLTNDDGIFAPGLWALYEQLSDHNEVEVIAPDRERSAVGHGITLHNPLRVHQIHVRGPYRGYAVNGTPADCVKLGIMEILDEKPDIVISGINPGANVGININYSGTVAAAREAALFGITGIAVSLDSYICKYYDTAAQFIDMLIHKMVENGLPPGTTLNVNVPDKPVREINGVKISRQALKWMDESFEKRIDPRNRTYYWQRSDAQHFNHNPEYDGAALCENYISVTPIKCDLTDDDMLCRLKTWEFNI